MRLGAVRLLVRLGRRQAGYTLIELVTVMLILSIILAALTVVFVSGTRAELNANHLYQAQQEARLALERLRRELHCASAVTPAGAATTSITIMLPADCPSPDTSVTYQTVSVSADRWQLQRAGVTVADYLTNDDVFAYFAPATWTLGRLHVDFPVNVLPSEGWKEWRLVDDIVLRNTARL